MPDSIEEMLVLVKTYEWELPAPLQPPAGSVEAGANTLRVAALQEPQQ